MSDDHELRDEEDEEVEVTELDAQTAEEAAGGLWPWTEPGMSIVDEGRPHDGR